MDVTNINDHQAYLCDCGSVNFNLLKSGGIECSDCGTVSKAMYWGSELEQAKEIIRKAINSVQQCFWPDIVRVSQGAVSQDSLLEASSAMQKAREIRLKEDSYEHAMEYILIR